MYVLKVLPEPLFYDGKQLHAHFGYEQGVPGNSIFLFRGGAKVVAADLVDLEDSLTNDIIVSPDMLHFLITTFHEPLITAVYRQRFWIAALSIFLNSRLSPTVKTPDNNRIKFRGDDLMWGDRKLSVSIAAQSGAATVIHIGLNITAPEKGTVRVPTVGLDELLPSPSDPLGILSVFATQIQKTEESILQATYKVRSNVHQ